MAFMLNWELFDSNLTVSCALFKCSLRLHDDSSYYIAQNVGRETLANLANLKQFAKVLPALIYIIKLQVD